MCVREGERENHTEMDAEIHTHRRGQIWGGGERESGDVQRVRER